MWLLIQDEYVFHSFECRLTDRKEMWSRLVYTELAAHTQRLAHSTSRRQTPRVPPNRRHAPTPKRSVTVTRHGDLDKSAMNERNARLKISA
jgi:hypothetical protein